MDFKSSGFPQEVLPNTSAIDAARSAIHRTLPSKPLGEQQLENHLENDITPGLNQSSLSPRYYGFVTGGTAPAAATADNYVTQYDQNVQVHLPNETIATDIEYHALNMLCELIGFDVAEWKHRTFTTGATGSNVMGLICGREGVYACKARDKDHVEGFSVAQSGIIEAFRRYGDIQIIASAPHSSIKKAAAIAGLGHDSVKDCGSAERAYKFDLEKLESYLAREDTSSIIVISCCEVNAGMFAVESREEMLALRRLADQYGAWIHADAAMGFMARILPPSDPAYAHLLSCVDGLDLCDSVTGDGHKLLNVPYDTGFFLSRHLDIGTRSFQNPGAAYLSSAGAGDGIPSPLQIGLENSRRFRALPVYANLVAYGGEGYVEMLVRQVTLARMVAEYLLDSEGFDLYVSDPQFQREDILRGVFMIVMFRARDEKLNEVLVQKINETRRIYTTRTMWEGRPAARIAVSNWRCWPERDFPVIKEVLDGIVGAQSDSQVVD